MRNNTYKTRKSVPYRLLESRLMPTYRREHPEQPATVLPLSCNVTQYEEYVKQQHGGLVAEKVYKQFLNTGMKFKKEYEAAKEMFEKGERR